LSSSVIPHNSPKVAKTKIQKRDSIHCALTVVLLAVGLEYEFIKQGTKQIYLEKLKKFSLLGWGRCMQKICEKTNIKQQRWLVAVPGSLGKSATHTTTHPQCEGETKNDRVRQQRRPKNILQRHHPLKTIREEIKCTKETIFKEERKNKDRNGGDIQYTFPASKKNNQFLVF
jgi:hypothetical protein